MARRWVGLVVLLAALVLIPAFVSAAGPAAQRRGPALISVLGLDADGPNPTIVLVAVIGPQGLRCPIKFNAVGDTSATATVLCRGPREARRARVRLIMAAGPENAAEPTDVCSQRQRLRGRTVELTCEVDLPVAVAADLERRSSGAALPDWADTVVRQR